MTLNIQRRRKQTVKPLYTEKEEKENRSPRRRLTDTIKLFVCYADIFGSKSPQRYYMIFSKLLKAITGVTDRKTATPLQIQFLETCEVAIISGINEGMYSSKPYKDIYKGCKAKLEKISKLLK